MERSRSAPAGPSTAAGSRGAEAGVGTKPQGFADKLTHATFGLGGRPTSLEITACAGATHPSPRR